MKTFLHKQLEHIKAEVFGDVIQDRVWRQLFFVDTGTPATATSAKLKRQTPSGSTSVNTGMGPITMVNSDVSSTSVIIHNVMTGFEITKLEIEQAQSLGQNISSDGMATARTVLEQQLNDITLTGDSTRAMTGLFSKRTQVVAADDASTSSPLWTAKTGQEIVNDVVTAMLTVANPFSPKVIMASRASILTAKKQYVGSSSISAYRKVEEELGLAWVEVPECATGGTGATKCFVIADNIPSNMYVELPQDIRMVEDYQSGLVTVQVGLWARTGGLVCPQPTSLAIVYGI